jgi:hypothetical protein
VIITEERSELPEYVHVARLLVPREEVGQSLGSSSRRHFRIRSGRQPAVVTPSLR